LIGIDKHTIAYLRFVHGFFNAAVLLLFVCQGYLGLRIRKNRKTGKQAPQVNRRHRKVGPFLAVLGVFGFLAGKTLVYIDHGHFFEHALHYITGAIIVLSIIATFFISRKIKGADLEWRNLHFRVGVFVICLYFVQAFLGAGILF
jgi:hypothetical protein